MRRCGAGASPSAAARARASPGRLSSLPHGRGQVDEARGGGEVLLSDVRRLPGGVGIRELDTLHRGEGQRTAEAALVSSRGRGAVALLSLDLLLQLLLLGNLLRLQRLRLALEEGDAETPLLCVDVLLRVHAELDTIHKLLELRLPVLLLDAAVPLAAALRTRLVLGRRQGLLLLRRRRLLRFRERLQNLLSKLGAYLTKRRLVEGVHARRQPALASNQLHSSVPELQRRAQDQVAHHDDALSVVRRCGHAEQGLLRRSH
mmetsp:Transcript_117838/g.327598  ORF Transcript_117838/g.327598 Transcript_117838/m.327598 type:complete len:260 (-) Transcript_117838:547-1326(-)